MDRGILDLANARRLVVKLGSAVVLERDGSIARARLQRIVGQVLGSLDPSAGVVFVCSGAVGAGMRLLGVSQVKATGTNRWACAAAGQSALQVEWTQFLSEFQRAPAQVLLTEDDFSTRKRYVQVSETLKRLLHLNAVVIVNENDSASGKFAGRPDAVFDDNDRLAALVASALDAGALILMSDVDGVYDRPPWEPHARLLRSLSSKRDVCVGATSRMGRGGMGAKIDAALLAARSGVPVVIGNGHDPCFFSSLMGGQPRGTYFVPSRRRNKRRRWLIHATAPRAELWVNDGARVALARGNASLLAKGIERVVGEFVCGDVLSLCDGQGRALGRGVSRTSSSELRGPLSSGSRAAVAVKRDDLVIFDAEEL